MPANKWRCRERLVAGARGQGIQRHDASNLSVAAEHRQMANLLFFHAPHSRCSIIIFEAADNHRRHDPADRCCLISAFRSGSHRHVAVSDDAEGLLALTDQHVSNVMRRHPLGNLL
jgi:hypothetical protein